MPSPLQILVFSLLALVAVWAIGGMASAAWYRTLQAYGLRNPRYTASGRPRSGKWRAFERDLIQARGGKCEACGETEDPQGHHDEDFHSHPEKELDPDNITVLCGPKGRNCHLRIGHSFDYRAINPNCREDTARQRHRVKTRVYE